MMARIDNRHFWIGIDNGVLYFTYKKGVIIDLPVAIKTVGYRLSVQDGKYFPVLCDVGGISYISRPARLYLSRQGTLLVKALALVCSSPSTTATTQFYQSFHTRSIPTGMFETQGAALRFLRSVSPL